MMEDDEFESPARLQHSRGRAHYTAAGPVPPWRFPAYSLSRRPRTRFRIAATRFASGAFAACAW